MPTIFNYQFFCFVEEIPDAATRSVDDTGKEDEFGAKDYRTELDLKHDHNSRPLFVVSLKNLIHVGTTFKLCHTPCLVNML